MPTAPASICPDELPFGVLGRPHGVSGEISFRPYHVQGAGIDELPFPAPFTLGPPGERRAVVVSAVRKTAQGFLVRFKGVSSRETASQLTGRELWVRRESLPPLHEDEFYVEDLVGCAVHDLKGDTLGVVKGVFWNGAHDVMSLDNGDLCIPVVPNYIVGVDRGSRIVTVDLHE